MKKLAFTTIGFTFGLFSLAGIFVLGASAEPRVDISPSCGPADPGFNIVMNINGFKPNSNVMWAMVGSDSKFKLSGYFETNGTGGINDVTFADDLKPDHYKMYFGDDANSDNAFDIGAKRVYANVTIPCKQ